MSSPTRYPFCWLSNSKGLRVRRWYHSLCVQPLDIKAVKTVARFEQVAGAKINFDKSKGLRLDAWKGGVHLPGPFRWSKGPVRILGVWFGTSLQLERNWSKIQATVGTWLRSVCPEMAGQRCAPYTSSPWSFTACLYFLCLRIIDWRFNDPSPNYFSEGKDQRFVDRPVVNIRITGV